MIHAEALQLVATLRTMYPAGESSPDQMDAYADLLEPYDLETASRGLAEVMHTHLYPTMPPWAFIEQAIQDSSQPYTAWKEVVTAITARANTPMTWNDRRTGKVVARMGGWTKMLEWDGSLTLLRDTFVREYQELTPDVRAQIGSGTKRLNLTAGEWCEWCQDQGWLLLAGTMEFLGCTYETGATACRWCEMGEAVYRSATRPWRRMGMGWPGIPLESNYDEGDALVDPLPKQRLISLGEYAASDRGQHDKHLARFRRTRSPEPEREGRLDHLRPPRVPGDRDLEGSG